MWNTVGGLREEKIEAFHNIGMITCKEISLYFFLLAVNRILQILTSVRQKDLKLVQMMERCEVKQNLVSNFAKPVPRKFFCPCCKRTEKENVALVENACPVCGYKRK